MNLVALSTVAFDPNGHILINATPDTNEGESRRRVTRSPTLDGGAAFNDFGYSEPDRTIVIKWPPDRAVDVAVARMLQLNTRLIVSVTGGVYLAAPESYRPGVDQCTLRLLVAEKLSA